MIAELPRDGDKSSFGSSVRFDISEEPLGSVEKLNISLGVAIMKWFCGKDQAQ
jgi:hypothetical protein